jgi:signal transduction histidine kinase
LLALIAGQSLFIVIAMAAFPLLAPYTSYANIADGTVRGLLSAALLRAGDGTIGLAPSAALRDYAASRPSLAWAVVDPRSGRAVAGSAPDLVAMVAQLGRLLPRGYGNLETERPAVPGDVAFVTTAPTAFGDLVFVTAGNVFSRADVASFASEFLPAIIPMFAPVLFGALVMIPLVVRRLLRPLRAAAQAAGAIDIRSLDQRLPLGGLPTELRPLVVAINHALDRLDAGFARQRLFTANAAHELRTPVAILQARIDSLPADAAGRTDLGRDIRRIALLIDQLLAVARIGHSEAVMADAIDLVALVRGLVADCAPLAIRSGRQVAFNAPPVAVHVAGNARALSSAVANLIDNALRAEPAGGTVEVHVTGGAEIVVVDHGPGIAAEDRPFVFEPFWRKDERTPGTGLGLAIASDVVALHGGTLSVAETPGGGATFRVALMLSESAGLPTRQAGAING